MAQLRASDHHAPTRAPAFTLIELLVVIAIIALLVGLIVPSLAGARDSARSTKCLSNLKQLAIGWNAYSDENRDVAVAHRAPDLPGGTGNPSNHYQVGNGLKFRPTWVSRLGHYVGVFPFHEPSTTNGRQDFDSELFACTAAPLIVDERNAGYGYNYQILGNSRITNGRFHNHPVKRSSLQAIANTLVAADSLGTAAATATVNRLAYSNDGRGIDEENNEGYIIDPPRLTPTCDRTSDGHRSGPAARHGSKSAPGGLGGRTAAFFADGHAALFTLDALGYVLNPDGSFPDAGPGAHNRLFSGDGTDRDPPNLP